ncbi:MAG TPA: protease inhibitor I42 family protein [Mesotoga infera]|jgi:inhibitor of cysteine peptidase|uniref:Proteinase inhibitor I42, chagasin n=1 Tax=Mesotoga infera TaxID=1236046 RepID=A0A7Z7LE64_9BACT|nr:protease inhibitor I42 family protein [Mesotoga infera]MBP8660179.1 protease inhibitor I42 family protein [Mesotoga sp.]NLI07604.1 protease inhibitor I42 family protein [Thermotogaceae bacterium]SSC12027.1 Proteinase inhibitor I42, chagasin [Mesotoga infera]HNR80511.1 protease inhibitor I42 family protein [Mesotoga infera]HNS66889.1 protease inhibitor I42 family protein [Mesotoga infera]
MKKSFVLVLLLVSAFTVLFSSELKDSGNWMKATQLAVLEIDENPTTGYLWHISVEPSGVLRNFLEEYMTGSAFPGAPSVKGWIMTAAKEGKALLTLKLYRDWEGERKAIDFRAVTVDVSGEEKGQVDLKIVLNELELGSTATVTLEENGSTGYTWGYHILGEGLQEIKKETIADTSGLVGAPAKVIWTFQAVDKGYTTIVFRYFRSWEGEGSAVDFRAFNVLVE